MRCAILLCGRLFKFKSIIGNKTLDKEEEKEDFYENINASFEKEKGMSKVRGKVPK